MCIDFKYLDNEIKNFNSVLCFHKILVKLNKLTIMSSFCPILTPTNSEPCKPVQFPETEKNVLLSHPLQSFYFTGSD